MDEVGPAYDLVRAVPDVGRLFQGEIRHCSVAVGGSKASSSCRARDLLLTGVAKFESESLKLVDL